MTRAALYARYSSDLQAARSVADQLDLLRREAASRGWQVVAEYADEAISGASMATRPGLQTMMIDAARGGCDVVMAEALDRLSRDQADTALIHRALSFAEVRIVTISEQDVTALHVGFKGIMNSMFLAELGAKTRRGLAARVRDGASAGGRTYGYRVAGRGELEIDTAESAIVREMHDRYAAGTSPRALAADLNARGVPGPRGAVWQASTIHGQRKHGNGILNNEMYVGRTIWNRRRKVTDPATGRKRMRENPPEMWIIRETPELAILTPEQWAATKAAQGQLAQKPGAARRRPTRPLSGLLSCASCGGPMTVVAAGRYGCSHNRQRGTCPEKRSLPAAQLEARTFAAIERLLREPEALQQAAAEWRGAQAERDAGQRKRHRRLTADLARVQGQIKRCVDAIVDGRSNDEVRDRLDALTADKARLTREVAAAAPQVVAVLPAGHDEYARLVHGLARAAADQDGGSEVREALRQLITGIRIGFTGDGQAELTVEGDLAALLTAEQKRTPGAVSGSRGSLKVGAGTGFEPVTFRL